jgi:superfamily II DNA or RNA helicase
MGKTPRELQLYRTVGDDIEFPFGVLDKIFQAFRGDIQVQFDRAYPQVEPDSQYLSGLYPYQENAVSAIFRKKNGVVVAPCGSGKTQIGLAAAMSSGLKTLWITHTSDLFNQSLARLQSVFGVSDREIGRITAGKVEIGSRCTFATVQTLHRCDLALMRDEWDMIIVDEAHRCVGGPTLPMMFYRVLSGLNARYKIGLTATPFRPNKMELMMFAVLGGIIHTVDQSEVTDQTVPMRAKTIRTRFYPDYEQICKSDSTIDFTRLINAVAEDHERNQMIVAEIEKCVSDGLSVLVLSDRVCHLSALGDLLDCPYEIITGSVKKNRSDLLRRFDENGYPVLLATYPLAKEGLDIRRLGAVVLATPIKDRATVIQSIGRAGRSFPGKSEGLIIDFSDPFSLLEKMCRIRKNIYKKMEIPIEFISCE